MVFYYSAKKRWIRLNIFVCSVIFLLLANLWSDMATAVWADDVKQGDTVTIITPGTEARLCPEPACGPDQHITRIPEGTAFKVLGTEVFAIGTFKVTWFEITYQDQRGWISIYDTDKAKN